MNGFTGLAEGGILAGRRRGRNGGAGRRERRTSKEKGVDGCDGILGGDAAGELNVEACVLTGRERKCS